MCAAPFPRAILDPAARGGLTGVDGWSSETWDQYCQKTYCGPGGQVPFLPGQAGDPSPGQQAEISPRMAEYPQVQGAFFLLTEDMSSGQVSCSLSRLVSCLSCWRCVIPHTSFWNRITQELYLRPVLTFTDAETQPRDLFFYTLFLLSFF